MPLYQGALNRGRGNEGEPDQLAPRHYRRQQRHRRLGNEDDHDTIRWLLQHLEQAVGRLGRHGFGVRQDVDFPPALVRGIDDLPPQRQYLLDADAGLGGILRVEHPAACDVDDTDIRMLARGNQGARAALAAGIAVRALAVQELRKRDRGAMPADAPRANEQVGVRYPAAADGRPQQ